MQVSRRQILRRDNLGFIVTQGVDRVRGAVCGRETLPHQAFGVHALLDSVTMPADYPMAQAPKQLKTVPKAFQLQVWVHTLQHPDSIIHPHS